MSFPPQGVPYRIRVEDFIGAKLGMVEVGRGRRSTWNCGICEDAEHVDVDGAESSDDWTRFRISAAAAVSDLLRHVASHEGQA